MLRVQSTPSQRQVSLRPSTSRRSRGWIGTSARRMLAPVLMLLQLLLLAPFAEAQSLLPPGILTATTYSKSQIDLVWDDPNAGTGADTGYIVEQIKGTSVLWRKVF